MKKSFVCLAVLVAIAALPAFADIAFTVPPASPGYLNHDPGHALNLGMIFFPNTNILVVGLGTYYQGDAINGGATEVVDLFQDSTQSVLASTTIVFALGLPGYQFNPIAPVELLAGQEYTVSTNVGLNSWAYSPAPFTDPSITFVGPSYVYTDDPTIFPTSFYPVGGYYGPNVEFTATPEPAAILLVGTLLLGLAGALKRKA
jgi:hypothetical protein